MSGITVDWRVIRASRQEKRASNRANAQPLLDEAGVKYQVHNGGAHLVVQGLGLTLDYWPGTGLWRARDGGLKGRGIRGLLDLCEPEGGPL